MIPYLEHISEDRRLVILRLLLEAVAYEANTSQLETSLAIFAVRQSRDQLHSELAWLEEQGLITCRRPAVGSVLVAKITTRGADVARGLAYVPGVKKPGPGE